MYDNITSDKKRDDVQDGQKNEPSYRSDVQCEGSSLLFKVAKHPLCYLLPMRQLSSHLLIKQATTLAATVTKKETI